MSRDGRPQVHAAMNMGLRWPQLRDAKRRRTRCCYETVFTAHRRAWLCLARSSRVLESRWEPWLPFATSYARELLVNRVFAIHVSLSCFRARSKAGPQALVRCRFPHPTAACGLSLWRPGCVRSSWPQGPRLAATGTGTHYCTTRAGICRVYSAEISFCAAPWRIKFFLESFAIVISPLARAVRAGRSRCARNSRKCKLR